MMKKSQVPSLQHLTYHNLKTCCTVFGSTIVPAKVSAGPSLLSFVLALNRPDDGPDRITLQYFVSWRTFMSAEVFHREIEKEVEASVRFAWFFAMYGKGRRNSSYGVERFWESQAWAQSRPGK